MKPEQLEKRVSTRIRDLRIARDMTQADLAKKLHTQAPYISDIERGIRSPGVAMVAKLAEALGVEPEEIFSEVCELVA